MIVTIIPIFRTPTIPLGEAFNTTKPPKCETLWVPAIFRRNKAVPARHTGKIDRRDTYLTTRTRTNQFLHRHTQQQVFRVSCVLLQVLPTWPVFRLILVLLIHHRLPPTDIRSHRWTSHLQLQGKTETCFLSSISISTAAGNIRLKKWSGKPKLSQPTTLYSFYRS